MIHHPKIKFAVAGCGHIGKRHAMLISNNPDAELVALADNNTAVAHELGNYQLPFFASVDDLLQSNLAFDVLCVATPNGLHEEHAVKGLRSRHHVIIEKPMALTKAGCERIIDASVQQQRRVFCVMQNRFSPPAVWLNQLVKENGLGKIFMVQVNCYWNRDERYYIKDNWHGSKDLDGGVLFTQFSHFIDTLLWIFGDITHINSKMANFNHPGLTGFEDSGIINFDFVQGGMGCLNFSTAVWKENLESSITVIAEKGTVKIGGQYLNEVVYCNVKDYVMPGLPSTNSNNHQYVFNNVVNVLRQGTEDNTVTDGLKVVQTIESIYKMVK